MNLVHEKNVLLYGAFLKIGQTGIVVVTSPYSEEWYNPALTNKILSFNSNTMEIFITQTVISYQQ